MSNIAAITRLRSLPELFRGTHLGLLFGWPSKTTSQYLYLWRQRDLIAPFGGHSDVFANLIVNAHPNWERALVMAMPSAIFIGIECLRRAGWTTQILNPPDAAVIASSTVFHTIHYRLERRTAEWFDAMQPGIILPAIGTHSARQLQPAWALADMLQREGWGVCGLTPDDIEWAELKVRDRRELQRAVRALDVDDEVVAGIARGESAIAKGRVVPHAAAKARMERWLKNP